MARLLVGREDWRHLLNAAIRAQVRLLVGQEEWLAEDTPRKGILGGLFELDKKS